MLKKKTWQSPISDPSALMVESINQMFLFFLNKIKVPTSKGVKVEPGFDPSSPEGGQQLYLESLTEPP